MVGADAEAYGAMVVDVGAPEEILDTCAAKYDNASHGWDSVLAPHARAGGVGEAQIEVHWGDMSEPVDWRDFLQASGLERLAREALAPYDLPAPMVIELIDCEDADAYWDPERRAVVLRHQLAAQFLELGSLE